MFCTPFNPRIKTQDDRLFERRFSIPDNGSKSDEAIQKIKNNTGSDVILRFNNELIFALEIPDAEIILQEDNNKSNG